MIEQAQQHFEAGEFAAAEALYRKMLEDEPDNPEVLFMLSLALQGQDNLDEPLELLDHALRVQPENPSLHYSLGNLQLRRKQLPDAEKAFHKATEIDPNFVAAQVGVAVVELSRGRFPAAEHALRKALKSEPGNSHALINMGIAMLGQERVGDAISYLQQVVDAEPENPSAQIYLGRAFLAAENSGFAIKCFENALQKMPGNVELLLLLAKARFKSTQYADAVKTYRELLNLGEESVEVVAGLARSLRALGQNREADGAFLRAMKLSGGDEELLLDLCSLRVEQGEYNDVITRLSSRIANAKNVKRMTRILAEAQLKSGRTQGLVELMQPVVNDGKPGPELRMLFARALLASGEAEAAEAQLDRLLELDPPWIEAVLFRARQLRERGERTEAISLLRAVQRRHDLSRKQRQECLTLLGDTLHENGSFQSAWEQYLGLDLHTADVIRIREEKPLQLEVNEPAETAMEREVAWSWPPQPPQDGRAEPVFVFAWPGTGRRPLLRALSEHSGICLIHDSVESQKKRRLDISHPQGKRPLNEYSPAQIQLARRKYWKALKHLDFSSESKLAVDAMWLAAESLPTLYRLFPQSHLIVLEQDPRDLAVSWLQAGYKDLEGMAAHYRQQLDLLNRCREGVPLNYIEVDSNRLHDEPGDVMREVISGLSLAWEPAVEQAWSAGRNISDLAISDSWQNYEPWLGPVYEKLQA